MYIRPMTIGITRIEPDWVLIVHTLVCATNPKHGALTQMLRGGIPFQLGFQHTYQRSSDHLGSRCPTTFDRKHQIFSTASATKSSFPHPVNRSVRHVQRPLVIPRLIPEFQR